MNTFDSLKHTTWEMQISRSVHTEVSEEGVVSTVAEGTWNGVSGIGKTAGERGAGGPSDGRSCAYADLDTAEAFGVGGDGIRERQKRDSRFVRQIKRADRVSGSSARSHLHSMQVFAMSQS